MAPVPLYESSESLILIWNLEKARAFGKKYLDQEKKGPNVDKKIGTLKRGRYLTFETV